MATATAKSTSDSLPEYSNPYTTATPTSPTSTASSTSTSDPDNGTKPDWSLYQYYFAFLALLVIVAVVSTWLLFRRKRKQARRRRVSRQHALSRDLEGTNINRGWTYGDWRIREAVMMGPWRRRDEEGLNEAGEAPPPYKPRSHEDSAILETGQHTSPDINNQGPAVPPPTLGRDQVGLKPPDYSETIARPLNSDEVGRGPSASTSIPAGAVATSARPDPSASATSDMLSGSPNTGIGTSHDTPRHE